jgi:ribonuclease Z
MTNEIDELTELAYEGSTTPLTTTPVVGTPGVTNADVLQPGAEQLAPDEVRVTILGSGDPFVNKCQASASVLIEVGNEQRDLFFFDLGSGSLANFDGLGLPVTSTTKVFISHLHADHVGDMPTLLWSLAKAGRRDPVEVWGPAGSRRRPRHRRVHPTPRGRTCLGLRVDGRAPRAVRCPDRDHRGAVRPARNGVRA